MEKRSKYSNKCDDGKRNCLTVEQKLKVIDRLNNKVSVRKIASEFNVSKTQIFQVKVAKENIVKGVSDGTLGQRLKQYLTDQGNETWTMQYTSGFKKCGSQASGASH